MIQQWMLHIAVTSEAPVGEVSEGEAYRSIWIIHIIADHVSFDVSTASH